MRGRELPQCLLRQNHHGEAPAVCRLWLSPEEEVCVPTAVASERIAREKAAAAARKKASRKRRFGTWQHRALLLPPFQIFATAPCLVICPSHLA